MRFFEGTRESHATVLYFSSAPACCIHPSEYDNPDTELDLVLASSYPLINQKNDSIMPLLKHGRHIMCCDLRKDDYIWR